MTAIEVKNLVKVYKKQGSPPVHAVNDISFHVEAGTIFGLLGPNGAGKTTTLKVLTTLLPPTSGSVSIAGFDVVRQPLDVRKNIVAVLQENAVEQFLSVQDNFRTFGRFQGLSKKEIETRSEHAMELFKLKEHRNQKAIDLSGGLKRRVQVAKVFMVDKPVIFLDEATTGMDILNKRATIDAVREEARRGRTIVLTTHIIEEAEELCDSLVIINHGKIVASGTPESVRTGSLRLYYLTMIFESITDRLEERLHQFAPYQISVKDSTISLTLRDQSIALQILTVAKDIATLKHFELTGASLEDAFVELMDANAKENS